MTLGAVVATILIIDNTAQVYYQNVSLNCLNILLLFNLFNFRLPYIHLIGQFLIT